MEPVSVVTAKNHGNVIDKECKIGTANNQEQNEEQRKQKKTKKRKQKAKKLVVNVSMTKYPVIKYVTRSIFKMRLSCAPYHPEYEDPKDEWDLFWTDTAV